MSNTRTNISRQSMFKQVDMGQSVVLNDDYLMNNQKESQIESIVLKTMEHAEKQARQIIGGAQQQAEELLATAREEASSIVEEGVQQKESIIQQGYEEGYEAGLQEGLTKVINETSDKIKAAELILDKAFEAESLLVKRYRSQITTLIQYVVNLVLTHELQTIPEQIADLIDKAADRIEFTGSAKIIMNPETLQQLKMLSPQILNRLANFNRLSFGIDESCEPYEMYLETVDSCFNISPQSQAEVYMKTVSSHIIIPQEITDLAQVSEIDNQDETDMFQGDCADEVE